MQRPANIETPRLLLLALLPEELEALIARDFQRISTQTDAIFDSRALSFGDLKWHLAALKSDERQLPWRMRVIVERATKTAIGSINLKGPPNTEGDVEIGWGLVESDRGKGYATEASAAVIAWALQQPGVRSVSATVPDDNPASQRVAQRLGFTRSSETRRDLPLWRRRKG